MRLIYADGVFWDINVVIGFHFVVMSAVCCAGGFALQSGVRRWYLLE